MSEPARVKSVLDPQAVALAYAWERCYYADPFTERDYARAIDCGVAFFRYVGGKDTSMATWARHAASRLAGFHPRNRGCTCPGCTEDLD